MKKTVKMLVLLLLAAFLFTLSACGKDNAKTKKNKSTVSSDTDTKVSSEEKDTESIEVDGDIILPKDGKITFGKDNKKSEENSKTTTSGGNTASGSNSDSSDTKDNKDTSSDNSDTSSVESSTGEKSWGDVQWN